MACNGAAAALIANRLCVAILWAARVVLDQCYGCRAASSCCSSVVDMEARQLHIRLANENEALSVDESVLRACSSVARGLPADADYWDLSNLLIEGEPVQRSTIISWLNMCYVGVHGEPFVREKDELPFSRVLDLFRLLAFADSVGATGGSIKPCVTEDDLLKLMMEITVNPQQQSQQQDQQQQQQQQQEQQMDEDPYTFLLTLRRSSYCWTTAADASMPYELPAAAPARPVSAAAKDAVTAQVAAQTEQLLYIAYKLRLQELVQQLKDFLTAATTRKGGRGKEPLLARDMLAEAIYSPRVLGAAGYNEAAGRAAWVRSQLQRPLLNGPQALLKFAYFLQEEELNFHDTITFPAHLRRLFGGQREGTLVRVNIDFLENSVWLDAGGWGSQMLLGMDVNDNA